MSLRHDPIRAAAETLRRHFGPAPSAAVIAGSGLGAFVEAVEPEAQRSYDDIPGFAAPGVEGHAGRLIVGRLLDRRIAVLSGRSHLYEGLTPDETVGAVRAVAAWGCRVLVVTNAAGGVNPQYRPGDLMLIVDHLNLTFASPLRGPNPQEWGPRFPDLSQVYDPELRSLALEAARREKVSLRQGVYAANSGPMFETLAEGRMLAFLGIDAVGMSTAPEVIAARQMGLRVLGLSYISNSLVHKPEGRTTHDEVLANSRLVLDTVKRLLARFFREMPE
jgi:purine-nucleoside phosphorylase